MDTGFGESRLGSVWKVAQGSPFGPLFSSRLSLLTLEGQGRERVESGSCSPAEFTLGLHTGDPSDSQQNPAALKADVNC